MDQLPTTNNPSLDTRFEIDPEERGKIWINPVTVQFVFLPPPPGYTTGTPLYPRPVQKTAGAYYEYDRDSVVWNLVWAMPSLFHDHSYEFPWWDDGTPITRKQADVGYKALILMSQHNEDRLKASPYYIGLRGIGWVRWIPRQIQYHFKPINYKPYQPDDGEEVVVIQIDLKALTFRLDLVA